MRVITAKRIHYPYSAVPSICPECSRALKSRSHFMKGGTFLECSWCSWQRSPDGRSASLSLDHARRSQAGAVRAALRTFEKRWRERADLEEGLLDAGKKLKLKDESAFYGKLGMTCVARRVREHWLARSSQEEI